ncbi:hydroxyacid dehydrogenase [Streptomyces iconiensis]|uniref:Hydroxyacid dehydrogenase n=1 Tax=Streptomyces iconiensis TaxID=1384038 RepID=A0ABT6ZPV1_9ACTN|nr:hydroxyacid dehydrogenase [Streptomyces iconiensis]MDJ1130887.1 hydroxyacid dehydrogenase [Streptomyces iconiensis]
MSPQVVDQVFPPPVRARLHEVAEVNAGGVLDEFDSPEAHAALAGTEVLLTCWGCPSVDAEVLDRAPLLRAVVHAAGTVKPFVTEEVHARGIAVSTAADANAVPVAEFTLAAVILGAKRAFPLSRRMSAERTGRAGLGKLPAMGTNGITVGVIGASRVGRRVLRLLACLDVRLLVHDPYLTEEETLALGAVSTGLDDLLVLSDVVTVHAPELPGTRRLLDRERLALLRDGALLVNTARGRLVDADALTEELVSGRIDAVLDVTDPEPLPPGSPLYDLPNVFLTPHLAGALGNELPRLGSSAVQEIARLGRGEPLAFPVTARQWEYTA